MLPIEIADLLRTAGFPVQDGHAAPLLNRLRREGLIVHEWRESSAGPPRKYLELSDDGRTQLAEFQDHLRHLTTLVESMGR